MIFHLNPVQRYVFNSMLKIFYERFTPLLNKIHNKDENTTVR